MPKNVEHRTLSLAKIYNKLVTEGMDSREAMEKADEEFDRELRILMEGGRVIIIGDFHRVWFARRLAV